MKLLITILLFITTLNANEFKLRKYSNVKAFYNSISEDVIKLSIEHNAPPAAILAIAGLESGYGNGYVAQITGNILSLGAGKNEKELPALNLPYCKENQNKTALFDPKDRLKCKKLVWKKRPKSLKKDYRPQIFAGTSYGLEYFRYNPNEYKKAKLKNVQEFLTKWININHKYKPFRKSREWLNEKVALEGKATLFKLNTNIQFLSKISGKKNSFNYRKSWIKKVSYILQNTGLTNLSKEIYYKKNSFEQAWNNI